MAGESRSGAPIRRADILIAGILLVLGQLEVALWGVAGSELAAHTVWAAVAVAALWRRSQPVAFAIVAIAAVGLRYRYGLTPSGATVYAITTPLALFGLGAYGRGTLRSVLLAGVAVLALEVVAAAITIAGYGPLVGVPAAEWLGQLSIYLAAAGGGIALRDRSESLAAARRRAAAVPDEETAVGGALVEERARIARELQAVVAACVRDVLALSARARATLSDAPAEARRLLGAIGDASRDAMASMRRMLSLLRAEDGPATSPEPTAPRPPARPADLARLLARTERPPRWARVHWRALVRRQGLPALILAIGIIEAVLTAGHSSGIYGSASLALKLLGAVALALAFVPRRRYPLLTAIAIAVLLPLRVAVLDDYFTLNLALYLGAFVTGAYARSAAIGALGGLIVLAGGLSVPPLVGYEVPLGAYLSTAIITAAAWLTGAAGRRRLAEAEQLRELSEAEERRRELAVERALAVERREIARELHDVIGHGLTSITLGAAAADRLLESRPREAGAAVESIRVAGLEVEDELALLLKALAGRAEAPPPRLADLAGRLAESRRGPHPVRVSVEGSLEVVPIGQSGALSRVIQEAVHNAHKHGADGEIRVDIDVGAGAVAVVIENPLAAGDEEPRRGGLGLIGMRERVALYDGEFAAGPGPGSTWTVRATLPLETEMIAAAPALA